MFSAREAIFQVDKLERNHHLPHFVIGYRLGKHANHLALHVAGVGRLPWSRSANQGADPRPSVAITFALNELEGIDGALVALDVFLRSIGDAEVAHHLVEGVALLSFRNSDVALDRGPDAAGQLGAQVVAVQVARNSSQAHLGAKCEDPTVEVLCRFPGETGQIDSTDAFGRTT